MKSSQNLLTESGWRVEKREKVRKSDYVAKKKNENTTVNKDPETLRHHLLTDSFTAI